MFDCAQGAREGEKGTLPSPVPYDVGRIEEVEDKLRECLISGCVQLVVKTVCILFSLLWAWDFFRYNIKLMIIYYNYDMWDVGRIDKVEDKLKECLISGCVLLVANRCIYILFSLGLC